MSTLETLAKILHMVDTETFYGSRKRSAGKPTGRGNETKPLFHVKPKKKKFGEKKLSKKQRKKL